MTFRELGRYNADCDEGDTDDYKNLGKRQIEIIVDAVVVGQVEEFVAQLDDFVEVRTVREAIQY